VCSTSFLFLRFRCYLSSSNEFQSKGFQLKLLTFCVFTAGDKSVLLVSDLPRNTYFYA